MPNQNQIVTDYDLPYKISSVYFVRTLQNNFGIVAGSEFGNLNIYGQQF